MSARGAPSLHPRARVPPVVGTPLPGWDRGGAGEGREAPSWDPGRGVRRHTRVGPARLDLGLESVRFC